MKQGDRIEVLQNFDPYRVYTPDGYRYHIVYPSVIGYWVVKPYPTTKT